MDRVNSPPRSRGGGSREAADGGGGRHTLRQPAVYAARQARRDMSLPEVLLWQRLRGSPDGIAFRKQHPIGPYRADFYCAPAKLVIEVDGAAHDTGDRPLRDDERTRWLEAQGYSVLRVPAADVLANPDEVAASIVAYAARPLHHSPAASGLPPRPGEDPILPVHGEVARSAGGGVPHTRSHQ